MVAAAPPNRQKRRPADLAEDPTAERHTMRIPFNPVGRATVVALVALACLHSSGFAQNRAFSFAFDQPPTTAYGIAAST